MESVVPSTASFGITYHTAQVFSLEHITLKMVGAWVMVALQAMLGDISAPTMQLILVLTLIDLLSGLIIAWRNHNISSERLRGTLSKLFVYLSLLVIAKHCMTISWLSWLSPTLTGIVVVTELLSVFENLHMLAPQVVTEKALTLLRIQLEKERIKEVHQRMSIATKAVKSSLVKRKQVKLSRRGA